MQECHTNLENLLHPLVRHVLHFGVPGITGLLAVGAEVTHLSQVRHCDMVSLQPFYPLCRCSLCAHVARSMRVVIGLRLLL